MDRAVQGAHSMVDRVAEKAGPAVDRIRSGVDTASAALESGMDTLSQTQERWVENCRVCVRDHPLASVGVAVAAGILLSRLIRH